MKRSNAVNHSYTADGNVNKILDFDDNRSYICFHAVSGACDIVIGDATFADNTITIEEGVMWEPRVVLIGEVYFQGTAGNVLTVLY